MLNFGFIDAKRASQDGIIDGGVGGKESFRDARSPGVLATKGHDRDGRSLPYIHLKMNQALWEDEQISGVKSGGEELVIGGNEPDKECSFGDVDEFGGAGVDVWRVHTARCEIGTGGRDAQCVEAREVSGIRARGHVAEARGRCIPGLP